MHGFDAREFHVFAGPLGPQGKFDPRAMTITVEWEHDDGESEPVVHEHTFPAKFEVCGTCDGRGTHVNPSIDAGGITQQEFDDDPQFRADYFGGAYDVKCAECHGQRVKPEIDTVRVAAGSPEVKAAWKAYRKHLRAVERDAREAYHEAKMGY